MSRVAKMRIAQCSPTDSRSRLRQAQAFVLVAQLCVDDETDVTTPGVAASLAVLAAIAASDAATCHRLGKRSRAQNHAQAEVLLATLEPDGKAMARRFRDVVSAKDDSHYGLSLVSSRKARSLVGKAETLTMWAEKILRS
jgi:hypothetical protein